MSGLQNSILNVDVNGIAHFDGEIRNASVLEDRIEELKIESGLELNDAEISETLDIYESVFNHKSFTGRSGTFYKYEGLGSIYWHMVSKLLLAIQETLFDAKSSGADQSDLKTLIKYYYDVKEGIGVNKSPNDYGAFPTDPYSHTPIFSGVQQPGLTGQVKEDVITRLGELGINVKEGVISFNTFLIKKEEFLKNDGTFNYYNVKNDKMEISVGKNSLAFTFCQIPIVYTISNENKIVVEKSEDEKIEFKGLKLDDQHSKSIFNRDGSIRRISVSVKI